jgi:Surface antigen variable number repeat
MYSLGSCGRADAVVGPDQSAAYAFHSISAFAAVAQVSSTGPRNSITDSPSPRLILLLIPIVMSKPFRAFITQQAGEPYSQAKVVAVISGVQTKGEPEKVTVNVIPDAIGVRLNFILEPAYYLGMVDCQGAKYFSYTRLLQTADLQDEDPYDPGRVTQAKAALLRFFKHNGYFQAKVDVETKIDDANQLVNITFSVEMGKRARIGNVTVQGPADTEQTWLLQDCRKHLVSADRNRAIAPLQQTLVGHSHSQRSWRGFSRRQGSHKVLIPGSRGESCPYAGGFDPIGFRLLYAARPR